MAAKKKVLISFHLINPDSIAVLNGVMRFLRERHGWSPQLFLPPMKMTEADIHNAPRNGIDGILVNHPLGDDLADALLASRIPLATIGNSDEALFRRRERIVFSEINGEAIGRLAAEYLFRLGGRRTFAYFGGETPTRWSRTRLRGYARTLRRLGHDVVVLTPPLHESIRKLPHPTALFLAGDYLASQVYEAASIARIGIPDELSVLGVDNNPLVCDTIEPALSSIDRDAERQGYETALALDRLMRRRKDELRPNILRTPPLKVFERNSTSFSSPVTALIERANAYIAANALKGISAADVANHCGTSQSLLALRFRQYEHTTVREKILQLRLAEARRLLKDRNQKLEVVAARCGFNSANRLSHIFLERYGVSPRSIRPDLPFCRHDARLATRRRLLVIDCQHDARIDLD